MTYIALSNVQTVDHLGLLGVESGLVFAEQNIPLPLMLCAIFGGSANQWHLSDIGTILIGRYWTEPNQTAEFEMVNHSPDLLQQ